MKHSTTIFAAIVFAFIVYITIRGQLPGYMGLFVSNNPAPEVIAKAEANQEAGKKPEKGIKDAAKLAQKAAELGAKVASGDIVGAVKSVIGFL